MDVNRACVVCDSAHSVSLPSASGSFAERVFGQLRDPANIGYRRLGVMMMEARPARGLAPWVPLALVFPVRSGSFVPVAVSGHVVTPDVAAAATGVAAAGTGAGAGAAATFFPRRG